MSGKDPLIEAIWAELKRKIHFHTFFHVHLKINEFLINIKLEKLINLKLNWVLTFTLSPKELS